MHSTLLHLLTLILGVPDEAEGARRLLDRRLQERLVHLMGLEEQRLTYTDAAGLLRTESMHEHAALLPGGPAAAPIGPGVLDGPDHGVLELTDGQRLVGALRPAAPDSDAEVVAWEHEVLGVVRVSLDRVRRVRLAPAPAAAEGAADDELVMANGDRLSGFLVRISPSDGVVGLETDGTERAVPLDRLAEIRLANPAETPAGTLVWLADGSVVAVDSFRTSRTGEITLALALQADSAGAPSESRPAALALEDIRAIAFDAGILTPLARCAPSRQSPSEGRRWTEPAMTGDSGAALLYAADIVLPGPMSVEWTIPAGATRLAAEAELPPDMWVWGDCEVVVSLAGGSGRAAELFRARLSGDEPVARINVPLAGGGPARRLEIRTEPGRFGPIQDRVILRRPLLLLDR